MSAKRKSNTLRWILIVLVVVGVIAVGIALVSTQGAVNSTNEAFNALETQRAQD